MKSTIRHFEWRGTGSEPDDPVRLLTREEAIAWFDSDHARSLRLPRVQSLGGWRTGPPSLLEELADGTRLRLEGRYQRMVPWRSTGRRCLRTMGLASAPVVTLDLRTFPEVVEVLEKAKRPS